MILVPHPIPAVNKIGTFIVKTYVQKFVGPGGAATEGHLRDMPFSHGRPAVRAFWCFDILGHIYPQQSRMGKTVSELFTRHLIMLSVSIAAHAL